MVGNAFRRGPSTEVNGFLRARSMEANGYPRERSTVGNASRREHFTEAARRGRGWPAGRLRSPSPKH